MSSIQGISSAPAPSSIQVQKAAAQAVPQDKDRDGDIDKAGAVDREKGNIVDLRA